MKGRRSHGSSARKCKKSSSKPLKQNSNDTAGLNSVVEDQALVPYDNTQGQECLADPGVAIAADVKVFHPHSDWSDRFWDGHVYSWYWYRYDHRREIEYEYVHFNNQSLGRLPYSSWSDWTLDKNVSSWHRLFKDNRGAAEYEYVHLAQQSDPPWTTEQKTLTAQSDE